MSELSPRDLILILLYLHHKSGMKKVSVTRLKCEYIILRSLLDSMLSRGQSRG